MQDAINFLKKANTSLWRVKLGGKKGLLFAREPIVSELKDICVIEEMQQINRTSKEYFEMFKKAGYEVLDSST